MLRFMGSQRVRHNWATELNWTEGCGTKVEGVFYSNLQELSQLVQSWFLKEHKLITEALSKDFRDICLYWSGLKKVRWVGKRCVNNKAPDKQKGDYCPSFILIQKRHDFHLHCQHMESQEKIPRMLQNSDSAFTMQSGHTCSLHQRKASTCYKWSSLMILSF